MQISSKQKKIAGVTILYKPDISVFENIQKTAVQVDTLYIVDNSPNDNHDKIIKLVQSKNIVYIPNNQNLGVSAALNVGAIRAIKEGYSFLLTMDQDSKAEPNMVDVLMKFLYSLKSSSNVAIVSPFHSTAIDPFPTRDIKFEKILTAWTSGCLMNLEIFKKVGPFKEDLFIDFVDFEYCLRFASFGFDAYKVYGAVLKHELGDNIKKNNFFGIKLVTTNHTALRKYYITRNRLYVSKLYRKKFPVFFLTDIKHMIGDVLSILLFEEDKWSKFKMIVKGFLDYKRSRFGSYSEE